MPGPLLEEIKMMKTLKSGIAVGIAVGVAGLLTVACGDGGRATADAAIQSLQSSYDAVKPDAEKYVPEQTRSVDEELAGVKAAFQSEEYTKALTDAQALTPKVTELGAAAAAKKAELTKSWEGLSATLPGVVESIQTRVTELSKARRLPRGMSKDTVETAKAGVAEISSTWSAAVSSAQSANLTDAMSKAQMVKTKASEIMTSLGMPVPDALKS